MAATTHLVHPLRRCWVSFTKTFSSASWDLLPMFLSRLRAVTMVRLAAACIAYAFKLWHLYQVYSHWWYAPSLFQTAGSHPSRSPIDTRSSLTHTLPLVSKQFHKLCTTHDLFWKAALLRLADRESLGLWEEGLKRFVYDADCRDMRRRLRDVNSGGSSSRNGVRRDKRTRNAAIGASVASEATMDGHEPQCSSSGNDKDSTVSKSETLLDSACKAMERHPPQNHTATSSGIYQCIYRSVLQNHLRFQAPVFCMPWVFFCLHTLHIIWWRIISLILLYNDCPFCFSKFLRPTRRRIRPPLLRTTIPSTNIRGHVRLPRQRTTRTTNRTHHTRHITPHRPRSRRIRQARSTPFSRKERIEYTKVQCTDVYTRASTARGA